MQFLYHKDAGEQNLRLENADFNHLIKARRMRLGERLILRNLRDDKAYSYKIDDIARNRVALSLQKAQSQPDSNVYHLHLLWAVIDVKHIEKSLPLLNELGVGKISFFYSEFSQRHFKLDLARLNKILINSCQQCGRVRLMELEVAKNLAKICEKYAPFVVFDFGGENIANFPKMRIQNPIMLGAEGGFSQKEREKFRQMEKVNLAKIMSLDSHLILQSHTASVFLASVGQIFNVDS